MKNPFLERAKKHCHGTHAERKTAKRMGGNLTPASGALEGAKGDIVLPEFLIENKATKNRSISLKLDWLLKIAQEAIQTNKRPALAIQFVTLDGTPVHRGGWVLMREQDFTELVEVANGEL